MTTIAMAAGMLPSALAVGDGGEFRAPMAIAVIGGLIVSTVLSLVFVPSFFTVMDDLSRGVSWIGSKLFHPNESEDEGDAVPVRVPPMTAEQRALAAKTKSPARPLAAE